MAILGDSAATAAIEAFGTVGTAMVTPFNDDGTIDWAGVEKVADHLVNLGNDMLVVSGTTGESPTTTDDEKIELLRVVRGAVGTRAKLIAGTGNNVTAHTVDLSERSAAAGADGLLVVTPYYSKPTQPAIAAHMRAAADSTDLPVMLYDIPGRSGVPITTETLLGLADHPNILAVKDAKGDLFASQTVMAESSLVYYSGEDALNLPLLAIGALGLVSVAGHVCSDRFAAMVQAVYDNDLDTARRLSYETAGVVDALMNHMPGVISAKAALQAQGILTNRGTRMPLLPADEEQTAFVTAQLTRSGYLSE
ncbi:MULTISPECIES: 4-hydroxy-tetrahydrodipicolinate synthase [Brevibacterium]|uniref:4-hydroxy-tetrahydrodipicolinate synthase n=5 Tax=Bacteria TaxID=2 RepID=K9AIA7_9MICO|nr:MULTISPECIES: 4-hydroxy-tetrahydrodipicolinate synthase [Brevibacterium]NJE65436.1 4-hydroxy-tetrahydrodipicolinate synthase [Brevibacterium sp. LS14]SIG96645.1 dihydrodipicolinate synthase [Mycobacteroides abscessus subsp. abscessus]EKU47019.1 dihydrodipicolinate synthase [Brevibacterium casei S18]KZE22776.1 4-hydroxy-tetrahydrodipicolinate synthase [Brevibacterium casei]MCM1014294.1 4-hydroxy-tetrahydrodipicolinate synthase [Brevibacterium sp. XM4083]